MIKANEYMRSLYLDYFNNYLTIEKFAIDNEISFHDAGLLISIGKELHHQYVRDNN